MAVSFIDAVVAAPSVAAACPRAEVMAAPGVRPSTGGHAASQSACRRILPPPRECVAGGGHQEALLRCSGAARTTTAMAHPRILRAAVLFGILGAGGVVPALQAPAVQAPAAQGPAGQAAAAPRGPAREITQITPELFRARNGNWYTIFLVTPAGIVLGDPINVEFARWLKGELATRFTQPVRYVVYSHSHYDHASGGEVFADTAHVRRAREHAAQHGRPLPAHAGRHVRPQRQRRHRPRRDRHPDQGVARHLRPRDRTRSPRWIATRTVASRRRNCRPTSAVPTSSTPSACASCSAARRWSCMHPGLNHSDDATVMYFPAERVVFATEFLADALVTTSMRSMPSACGAFDGSPIAEWIKSYRDRRSASTSTSWRRATATCSPSATSPRRASSSRTCAPTSRAACARARACRNCRRRYGCPSTKGWVNYERLRVANITAAYENLKVPR